MNPACLDNLIGFRTCGYTDSQSGIYIDDMPAGAIARLSALTDPERVSAGEVWAKIQNRASAQFVSDIRKALPYRFKTADILANAITAQRKTEFTQYIGTGRLQGVRIRVNGTPLMNFVLPWVQLWLDANSTVPIKVIDLQTGEELYSESFDGVDGNNVFNTSFEIPLRDDRRDFFVCFDDTGLTTYQTQVSSSAWCNDHGISKYATLNGGVTPTGNPTVADVTQQSETGGLIPCFTLRCSLDGFICANRLTLAQAFCLLCVVELYREILEGDGILSRYTMLAPDEIRTRIGEYTSKYGNELTGVLANMNISDPVCIECKAPIQIEYVTG